LAGGFGGAGDANAVACLRQAKTLAGVVRRAQCALLAAPCVLVGKTSTKKALIKSGLP